MGGTTAKACLIEGGEPRLTDEMEVGGDQCRQRLLGGGGYLVRSPTIDLAEIGAGGGSLAGSTRAVRARGPRERRRRSGSGLLWTGRDPADRHRRQCRAGFSEPSASSRRRHAYHIDAAKEAIDDHSRAPLGLVLHAAACGIHAVADAAMTRAIQAVSSEIGRSPGDFAMVAFGGNGAVHGATLAAHAGISDIIIPPASGVFSALGLFFARIQHRLVKVCWYDSTRSIARPLTARRGTARGAAALMAGEGVALVATANCNSPWTCAMPARVRSSPLPCGKRSDPGGAGRRGRAIPPRARAHLWLLQP